ncbi:hypothetical protein SAMN05192553_101653 [Cyclobacterium xiamenense]|uniref:Uncharacterized protein n=1 Tax=Cyclobacterium xiamenense TaxID=1297121 RepID=A0A1H6U5I1_9BACT|nr:hypothetical protein SAMN05192553_101653 [Cyclobacterium xiamenense]
MDQWDLVLVWEMRKNHDTQRSNPLFLSNYFPSILYQILVLNL